MNVIKSMTNKGQLNALAVGFLLAVLAFSIIQGDAFQAAMDTVVIAINLGFWIWLCFREEED